MTRPESAGNRYRSVGGEAVPEYEPPKPPPPKPKKFRVRVEGTQTPDEVADDRAMIKMLAENGRLDS